MVEHLSLSSLSTFACDWQIAEVLEPTTVIVSWVGVMALAQSPITSSTLGGTTAVRHHLIVGRTSSAALSMAEPATSSMQMATARSDWHVQGWYSAESNSWGWGVRSILAPVKQHQTF